MNLNLDFLRTQEQQAQRKQQQDIETFINDKYKIAEILKSKLIDSSKKVIKYEGHDNSYFEHFETSYIPNHLKFFGDYLDGLEGLLDKPQERDEDFDNIYTDVKKWINDFDKDTENIYKILKIENGTPPFDELLGILIQYLNDKSKTQNVIQKSFGNMREKIEKIETIKTTYDFLIECYKRLDNISKLYLYFKKIKEEYERVWFEDRLKKDTEYYIIGTEKLLKKTKNYDTLDNNIVSLGVFQGPLEEGPLEEEGPLKEYYSPMLNWLDRLKNKTLHFLVGNELKSYEYKNSVYKNSVFYTKKGTLIKEDEKTKQREFIIEKNKKFIEFMKEKGYELEKNFNNLSTDKEYGKVYIEYMREKGMSTHEYPFPTEDNFKTFFKELGKYIGGLIKGGLIKTEKYGGENQGSEGDPTAPPTYYQRFEKGEIAKYNINEYNLFVKNTDSTTQPQSGGKKTRRNKRTKRSSRKNKRKSNRRR
jgi:hypothetical protein